MNRLFFILILTTFFSCGKSNYTEEKKITVYGEVTGYKGIFIENAEIVNYKTNSKIITGKFGYYAIKADYKDTLIYNATDYLKKEISIKEYMVQNHENILHDSLKMNINLKPNKKFQEREFHLEKPVIYLYPEKETAINLKLLLKGKLETTFPKYNDGWNVIAYPDGKIFDPKTKRFYNSLFWNGTQTFNLNELAFNEGFVVAKKDLATFLISKLEYIGLNNVETNEFVQYWLPILEKHDLNCIRFLVNENYNSISTNEITPKPNTEIRVFMQFYNLEHPIEIPEQNLPVLYRKGFTLVEWGGCDVSENRIKFP